MPPPQADCCACLGTINMSNVEVAFKYLGAAVRWCFGVDPAGKDVLNRRDRRLVAQHEKLVEWERVLMWDYDWVFKYEPMLE